MLYKQLIFILGALFWLPTFADGDADKHYEDLFEQGSKAYKVGAYDSAKIFYSQIISAGLTSPELLYNLGNVHFKLGNIANSILNYERALKLAPHDADIQYNLNNAAALTVDKVEAIEPIFFKKWFVSAAAALVSRSWAWVVVSLICACCVFFSIFFLAQNQRLKQLSFMLMLALVFGAAVSTALGFEAQRTEQKLEAIIFAPTVDIKSEPSNNATVLYVVHEGLKIEVINTENDWVRAKFADGNTGWIPSQSIEII